MSFASSSQPGRVDPGGRDDQDDPSHRSLLLGFDGTLDPRFGPTPHQKLFEELSEQLISPHQKLFEELSEQLILLAALNGTPARKDIGTNESLQSSFE